MIKIIILFAALLITVQGHSAEYTTIPNNDYNSDIIGKFLRFKPQVLYLVLDNSPPRFMARNSGINRIVATIKQAAGNDIHEKEEIKDNMVFEVISIFKHIDPPPADWSDTKKKEYWAWVDTNLWFGIQYVLKDENRVLSTTGSGISEKTYVVSRTEYPTVKSYSYKITPNVQKEMIENARKQGINEKNEIDKVVRKVASILTAKNRFAVKKLLDPCSNEITKYCETITNGHELIACLKNNRDAATKVCEESLKGEFGSKPLEVKQVYNGVLIPKGSTFFYDSYGAIIGATVSQNFQYRNILFKKGQIRFNESGLSVGTLVEDQYIDGTKYKACDVGPFFHNNGTVENAILAEDTQIGEYIYKEGTQIVFHSNGNVQQGTLAQKATIKGMIYKPDSNIWFNRDGTIMEY